MTTWPRTIRCGNCGHVAQTNEEASAILAGVGCEGHINGEERQMSTELEIKMDEVAVRIRAGAEKRVGSLVEYAQQLGESDDPSSWKRVPNDGGHEAKELVNARRADLGLKPQPYTPATEEWFAFELLLEKGSGWTTPGEMLDAIRAGMTFTSRKVVSPVAMLEYGARRAGWNLEKNTAGPTSYRLVRREEGETT